MIYIFPHSAVSGSGGYATKRSTRQRGRTLISLDTHRPTMVQAVVPAAGEGTRMRPLTDERPKGLVEVAGKPLLAHGFDALDGVADECVVVVGHRGQQIVDHFGSRYGGLSLSYVTQQEPRGLADALSQAAPLVDGPFISLNGDNVIQADLRRLVRANRDSSADVTALTERVPREQSGRGAVFELEEGEIVGIVEKPTDPPSTLVPRGCYVFSPAIFEACRRVTPGETGERELTDAISLVLEAGGTLETVPLDGWCVNVNTPEDCKRVETLLAGEGNRN